MLPQQKIAEEQQSQQQCEEIQRKEDAPLLIRYHPVEIHQDPDGPEYEPECRKDTCVRRPHNLDDGVQGNNISVKMRRKMELLEGIEPSTCALPRRRYTSEPQQLKPLNEGFIDKCLVITIAH